jgi:hypothetical protein
MAFRPLNTRPELPLDDVITALASNGTNPKELSPEDLVTYRKQLSAAKKMIGAKMAETATKEHNYDEAFVTAYIDKVLDDGFSLIETKLSAERELVEAQQLKRWANLIAQRVELSPFGSKKFKIHSLRLLRSDIAQAKTLHHLRQAVAQMLGPLELYREHRAERERLAADREETMKEFESLLVDIERKDKLLAERKRVIDEILAVYSEDDNDLALLRNVENAKNQLNLSDAQAAALFGVNRRRLQTWREKLIPLDEGEELLLVADEESSGEDSLLVLH